MLYNSIEAREKQFHEELRDAYGKEFTVGDSFYSDAIALRHSNDDWYYKSKSTKKKIVLHFTAGILHGDIGELTRSRKVSVSYVVARDGTLYELFSPEYWSYHLGRGASGGNTKMSRESIGIEISNFGPLNLDSERGVLKTWSGKDYCSVEQTEAYMHVPGGFRGRPEWEYFATYTAEQYRVVDELITDMCREFNILRKLPAVMMRQKKVSGDPGEGIWSHQNFRTDKCDVGPAFDWIRVIGK